MDAGAADRARLTPSSRAPPNGRGQSGGRRCPDPETLAALKRIEDALQKQNKLESRGIGEIGSTAWSTGLLLAFGMQVALDPDPSLQWLWSLLSWANVGWLLLRHLGDGPA